MIVGWVQMQHLDYKSFSFIWHMLFNLTLSRHLNSTHHPSRSPFILCFISSSSHTSYTLYNHFFNPNICPLSCLLNNRIRTCSCTSSQLVSDNWHIYPDLLQQLFCGWLFYISIPSRVVSSRTLSPDSTAKHIKGCFYIRICS